MFGSPKGQMSWSWSCSARAIGNQSSSSPGSSLCEVDEVDEIGSIQVFVQRKWWHTCGGLWLGRRMQAPLWQWGHCAPHTGTGGVCGILRRGLLLRGIITALSELSLTCEETLQMGTISKHDGSYVRDNLMHKRMLANPCLMFINTHL